MPGDWERWMPQACDCGIHEHAWVPGSGWCGADGLVLLEGLLTRPDFARSLDAAYEKQLQQLQSPEAWGEVDGRLLPVAAWAGTAAGAAAGKQCPAQLLGAASILAMVPGARAGSTSLLLPAPLLAPTASASAPLPATPAPSKLVCTPTLPLAQLHSTAALLCALVLDPSRQKPCACPSLVEPSGAGMKGKICIG